MKVDALLQNQNIKLSNVSPILDRVNVGDIVRAQILEIATDEIILKLFDGSTVNASTSETTEQIDAKRGDFLDFKVKEKLDGKVILEPFKNQTVRITGSNEELLKQIKILGVPPESENLEIVKELKNNNIPINKSNFDKIIDVMTGFKDLNPAKAAFFIANKLGIEEKNISALKQITDEKVKISNSVYELLNTIDSIDDEVLIKSISDKLSTGKASEAAQNPETKLSQFGKQGVNPQENATAINEIKNLVNEAQKNISKTLTAQGSTTDEASALEKIDIFFSYNKSSKENLSEKFINFIERNFINQGKPLQEHKGEIPELVKNIITILKNSEENKNNLPSIKNVSNDENANLTRIDDYKKEIRNVLDKLHINLHSDGLKEDLGVKNLYKDLYSKLDMIKDLVIASVIPNKAEIISNIEHMENNIRFMNQLNSYNTYVQIPLNIWDRNTTGEIYILKRNSKKRKIDPENTTMLISLNTENIGQVDTFIGVNKKNISVSMRVEDNKIIEFIKGYHKELYQRFQDKGYKLVDLKFRIPEEDISLINVNEVAEKEFSTGKVSIDYRL